MQYESHPKIENYSYSYFLSATYINQVNHCLSKSTLQVHQGNTNQGVVVHQSLVNLSLGPTELSNVT